MDFIQYTVDGHFKYFAGQIGQHFYGIYGHLVTFLDCRKAVFANGFLEKSENCVKSQYAKTLYLSSKKLRYLS